MGYIGNKMSVRAYEAYESGEKPLSKWSKNDIIECVLNVRNDFQEKELKIYSKEVLKVFLICSSWHHTGSYFNETNFYSLDLHACIESNRQKTFLATEKTFLSSHNKHNLQIHLHHHAHCIQKLFQPS